MTDSNAPTGSNSYQQDPTANLPTSGPDAAIQTAVNDLEAQIAAASQPGSESASQGQPEAKTDPAPKAADLVQQALAEKKKRESQKAAAQKWQAEKQAIEAEREKERTQREELEGLLKSVGTAQGFATFLQKTGLDFNALAKAHLGLDHVEEKPDPLQKLNELEKRLAEKEESEKAARQKADDEARETQRQAAYQRSTQAVADYVQSKAADYELLADYGPKGIEWVLERAGVWLRDNQEELKGRTLTDEDERQVVDYFCIELENDLLDAAKAQQARLNKLKKLGGMGISTNTAETSNTVSSDQLSATEAELAKQLSQRDPVGQSSNHESLGGKPASTKFLTNDATIGSKPTAPQQRVAQSYDPTDDMLEKLIEQFR